jgi:hypothetical protein
MTHRKFKKKEALLERNIFEKNLVEIKITIISEV